MFNEEKLKNAVENIVENYLGSRKSEQGTVAVTQPQTGTQPLSGVVGRACDLLRSNTCSLLSTQLPKRRRLGNTGRYEKPAKQKKAEKKILDLICVNYVPLSDFCSEDGSNVPVVLPNYALTQEDVLFSGPVNFMTDDKEPAVMCKVLELLAARLPKIEMSDFEFVKVSRKTVSTPVISKTHEWDFENIKAIAGQGKVYVRLLKPKQELLENSCVNKVGSADQNVTISVDTDISEEELSQLCNMFPKENKDFLKGVLDENLSVHDAVNEILEKHSRASTSEPPTHDLPSKKPAKKSTFQTTSTEKCSTACKPKVVLSTYQDNLAATLTEDYTIHVKREEDLFQQVTLIYKRASIVDLKRKPNVRFEAGGTKEMGADAGGPTREFMHLAMNSLVEPKDGGSLLFTGEVDHLIPVHNWDLLDDGAFITAGKVVAHSILHGGQGFVGMSPAVVTYIETLDLDKTLINTTIEDIPDVDVRETISSILMSSKEELPKLIIENSAVLDLLQECGVVKLREDNRHKAVQKILLQQVIIKRKNEIEDIMKGMDSLSLLSFLKSHPCISQFVFPRKLEATPSSEAVQNLIVVEDDIQSPTSAQVRVLGFLREYVTKLGESVQGNYLIGSS